jgi:hypothetical protein
MYVQRAITRSADCVLLLCSLGALPNHMPNYREVDARYPADTFNSLYG